LGERRAAFEYEMRCHVRVREQDAQEPADPEVLFEYHGMHAAAGSRFREGESTAFRRQGEELRGWIHRRAFRAVFLRVDVRVSVANSRSIGLIHPGARSRSFSS